MAGHAGQGGTGAGSGASGEAGTQGKARPANRRVAQWTRGYARVAGDSR